VINDLLVAGASLILASTGTCIGVKDFQTELNINLETPDVVYDMSRSTGYLTKNHSAIIDRWKNEHEDHVWSSHDLEIGGLARGGIGVATRISMKGKRVDRYGVYWCPVINRIDVDIFYATTIFISKENQKNECVFNNILEHEHGHHSINMLVVKKYVDKLKDDLPVMVEYLEKDYIPREQVKVRFADMEQGLKDAIEVYGAYIHKEMTELNGYHDRPEEYERLSRENAICRKNGK
jgi:hypothetical protein